MNKLNINYAKKGIHIRAEINETRIDKNQWKWNKFFERSIKGTILQLAWPGKKMRESTNNKNQNWSKRNLY